MEKIKHILHVNQDNRIVSYLVSIFIVKNKSFTKLK